jgi:serine/threonine-protein kinase
VADPPDARVRRRERECDRFEAAWKAGQRPRIEDHLAAVPEAERPALLRELILLEVDYRRLAREQPRPEEYLGRFPTLEGSSVVSLLVEAAPAGPRPPSGLPATLTEVTAPSPRPLPPVAVAGPGPALARDVHTLLGTRLRFISLVILGIYSFRVVSLGWFFLAGDYARFVQYGAYLPANGLAFLTAVLLAVVLWKKRSLSLPQLRGIELTLFGLVLMQLTWDLAVNLFLSPPFLGITSWANTSADDTYFLLLFGHYATLPFVLLIITYATLIPCSWRRCTLVVGVMALTPMTILVVACVGVAVSPFDFFMQCVLVPGMILGIAVAIAAYGTHRIEVLSQEIDQARKLGQYQLKQLLGRGGMGEVYLAEHLLLKQPCAIKLIRPERAGDPAILRRFEREVQATARLKHWNTVQIYDYGHTADGTFYYVMEHLAGATLDQLVKAHGPLPAGRVVHVLRQACAALREAHALGLIHRDIKPANIMLCERGGVADVVKLLDFGLVKAVALGNKEETLTQEGAITGTPAYMSPEQASGKDRLDVRSDIYSLGGVAYFLLTGRPPFERDRAIQVIVAHIHEPVRPLTDLRPEVPADLQGIVLRCLEKDPARRFADVGSLDEALAACHKD